MKKIYSLLVFSALSLFSFPKQASALAMQLTVHIVSVKAPQRGLAMDPAASNTVPSPDTEFQLLSTNGHRPYLAVWEDANPISGNTSALKNYVGSVNNSNTAITLPIATLPADKTFVVAGGSYAAGTKVRIVSHNNLGNWMEGFVRSYIGTSMVITVDKQNGNGTSISDWDISLCPKILTNAGADFYISGGYNYLQGDTPYGAGSNATVYFNYYPGHVYNAYINFGPESCSGVSSAANYGCRADCTVVPVPPSGTYNCFSGAINIKTYKSQNNSWINATCSNPPCTSSNTGHFFFGTIYAGEDNRFNIFLQQVAP